MLELLNLTVTPKGAAQPLFAPLSLMVTSSDVVTVMGASGAGKSTLLDAIAGHLPAGFQLHGQIKLGGRCVTTLPAEARNIGVMFQDAVMFPHLSVGDNLAFGLRASVRGRAARRQAVDSALETAGLAGFYDRDPATLSGGQRARAALMRALLAEPAVLLLDEPFSRLDTSLRAEIRGFVFEHARARGLPVLLVTHDIDDATAAAGPLITL